MIKVWVRREFIKSKYNLPKISLSLNNVKQACVSIMVCKVCKSPIGLEWTQKLQNGEILPVDMALQFDISISKVNEHMLNIDGSHNMDTAIERRAKFSELIQDPDYLLDEIHYMMNRIHHWLESLDETDPDSVTIKQGTTLIKELRETVKLVYELQGKFNKGDTYHQQFIQIQGDYNQFTNAVLEANLCPGCTDKILKITDNLISNSHE
jgi:hypothetical protein